MVAPIAFRETSNLRLMPISLLDTPPSVNETAGWTPIGVVAGIATPRPLTTPKWALSRPPPGPFPHYFGLLVRRFISHQRRGEQETATL